MYEQLISSGSVQIPVLVMMGENDAFVPPARSQQLVNALQHTSHGAHLFFHPGAHMVPTCSGDCKKELCAFIDKHGDLILRDDRDRTPQNSKIPE